MSQIKTSRYLSSHFVLALLVLFSFSTAKATTDLCSNLFRDEPNAIRILSQDDIAHFLDKRNGLNELARLMEAPMFSGSTPEVRQNILNLLTILIEKRPELALVELVNKFGDIAMVRSEGGVLLLRTAILAAAKALKAGNKALVEDLFRIVNFLYDKDYPVFEIKAAHTANEHPLSNYEFLFKMAKSHDHNMSAVAFRVLRDFSIRYPQTSTIRPSPFLLDRSGASANAPMWVEVAAKQLTSENREERIKAERMMTNGMKEEALNGKRLMTPENIQYALGILVINQHSLKSIEYINSFMSEQYRNDEMAARILRQSFNGPAENILFLIRQGFPLTEIRIDGKTNLELLTELAARDTSGKLRTILKELRIENPLSQSNSRGLLASAGHLQESAWTALVEIAKTQNYPALVKFLGDLFPAKMIESDLTEGGFPKKRITIDAEKDSSGRPQNFSITATKNSPEPQSIYFRLPVAIMDPVLGRIPIENTSLVSPYFEIAVNRKTGKVTVVTAGHADGSQTVNNYQRTILTFDVKTNRIIRVEVAVTNANLPKGGFLSRSGLGALADLAWNPWRNSNMTFDFSRTNWTEINRNAIFYEIQNLRFSQNRNNAHPEARNPLLTGAGTVLTTRLTGMDRFSDATQMIRLGELGFNRLSASDSRLMLISREASDRLYAIMKTSSAGPEKARLIQDVLDRHVTGPISELAVREKIYPSLISNPKFDIESIAAVRGNMSARRNRPSNLAYYLAETQPGHQDLSRFNLSLFIQRYIEHSGSRPTLTNRLIYAETLGE